MIGINPYGMDVIEWTDRINPILINSGSGGFIGRLDDPDKWRDWARSVILINTTWQATAPNPYQFSDWRRWAERFLQITV